MTVHTAKGLEFPAVFLCGMSEGVFPSKKTATAAAMEEERRLAFVALTRAQRHLFLTDAEGWHLDGSTRLPSRFIFNVDKALLSYTDELDAGLVQETNRNIRDHEKMLETIAAGPAFQPGDRVVHSILGRGEVVDIDRDKAAYTIRFDGIGTPRKINFKAKLDRENQNCTPEQSR